ncbi:putative porin [Prosthecobacter sp.]|uniref:putative porin n=1 Tax=Prosthecobacter sp. TaxID=1965333 RepID=UPI002486E735|nr:putative porin [Prosthecobacter sp.]MDI1315356.1 putative porin [Prosthecobacter sp.]
MLNHSQVWRRKFACFTASLLAATQPVLVQAQEPTLPAPLLAENTPPAAGPVPPPIAVDADPATTPVLPPPNAAAPQAIQPTPSQNVTLNLINRLVQKGVLSQAEAADLIQGAVEDAAFAKAQSEALAETQAAVMAQNTMPPVVPDPDEVRVTYIPESVKAEIRDQLRTEVFAQARDQKWAAPDEAVEWTKHIGLSGDIRMRHDRFTFADDNNSTGVFPNFNTINTGHPFDVSGPVFSPQLNVDKNRERTRLRMRLAYDIDLEDGFTAGIRMATGANNSPVSTNQTLGSASAGSNGQGGNFSKYELWLDRAFIRYEAAPSEYAKLTLLLGRFDNPYTVSSQIMWDEDVGLDGIAFKMVNTWQPGFKTFLTAGAYTVFNSDFNFPSNSPTKGASYNKYLLAAQFGVEFKITDDIELKTSLAYYDWKNIEGRLSDPFVPLNDTDAGSTDNTRPLFAQKGNTYRPIRNITPTALNGFGTTNQFQYFGLAAPFRQIAWNGRLDFNHYEPVQISLLGEYIKNLAFNQSAINSVAVNNRTGGGAGAFDGGDTAWYMGVNVGKAIPAFNKRGDWSVGLGYRHVESDAVIDGFTDSVFGGGGTNMEGYSLNAAMAISKRTWMRMAYMSATQIAGPALQTDVFLIDFSAKF